LLHDTGADETIHTLYMKSAAEAAGIKCKLVEGLMKFGYNANGEIVDEDGELIKTVWKTWSWSTVFG